MPAAEEIAPLPVPEPTEGRAVPRRVWGGALLQAGGRLFAAACTFATLALLARQLEPASFGRYTFYLAVFALLDALTDFGTGAAAVQRSSTQPERMATTLVTARRLRRRMAGVGALAVAVALFFLDEPDWPFVLLATLYQFTHGLELSATVYKNAVRWKVPVLARCAAALARLVFVAALLGLGVTSAGLHLVATALGSSLANGMLHLAARRHLPAPAVPTAGESAELLRLAWPLGIAAVCQQGYFYLDNLFVRAFAGEVELGHYNGAVRLMSFLLLGAQYASLAALPWLTRRRAAGDGAAAVRLAQPLFAGACFAMGVIAPHAAGLLGLGFGDEFRGAGPALVWLLGAVAVVHVGAVFVTAAVAFGATRSVLAIALSALALNGALNWLAVPRYGIAGAAAATLVTELFVTIGAAIALSRHGAVLLGERPWAWALGPLAFGAGLLVGQWVPGAELPWGSP